MAWFACWRYVNIFLRLMYIFSTSCVVFGLLSTSNLTNSAVSDNTDRVSASFRSLGSYSEVRNAAKSCYLTFFLRTCKLCDRCIACKLLLAQFATFAHTLVKVLGSSIFAVKSKCTKCGCLLKKFMNDPCLDCAVILAKFK